MHQQQSTLLTIRIIKLAALESWTQVLIQPGATALETATPSIISLLRRQSK